MGGPPANFAHVSKPNNLSGRQSRFQFGVISATNARSPRASILKISFILFTMAPTNQSSRFALHGHNDVAPINKRSFIASALLGAFDHFAVPVEGQFGLGNAHP